MWSYLGCCDKHGLKSSKCRRERKEQMKVKKKITTSSRDFRFLKSTKENNHEYKINSAPIKSI